jgi:hypothetical protein
MGLTTRVVWENEFVSSGLDYFFGKKDVLRVSTVTIFRLFWVLVFTWIRTVGILGKQRRS